MGRKTDEKQLYRLRWEYLKRSEIYADICIMFTIPFDNSKRPRNINSPITYYKYRYEEYCLAQGKKPQRRSLTEWVKLFRNYRMFGNIFNIEFDKWWSNSALSLKIMPTVVDMKDPLFYEKVFSTEAFCTDYILSDNDETLSPQKLLNDINNAITYMFLAIPLVGNKDKKGISSEIKKIRDYYKSQKEVQNADAVLREALLPKRKIRIREEELEKYLEVYDLRKQGVPMREVIKKVTTSGEDPLYGYVTRKYNLYQSKAKKIIRNAENFVFPGNY